MSTTNARTSAHHPRRLAAALLLPGLLVHALAACGEGSQPPQPSATSTSGTEPASSTSTEPASSEPGGTAPGDPAGAVPVYWIGETDTGPRLYREFHEAPAGGAQDPVLAALTLMTGGTPLDPDYSSPWSPASRIDVTAQDGGLLVDLSADALAEGTGSAVAELAVQQLVWTATAAAGEDVPVTITVDGAPADAWGAVRLGEPVSRAPQVDVQAPVWITAPQHGERLPAGPVGITGTSTAFEGTVLWEITDATGAVVGDGFATGGANGEFGEFAVQQEVQAGTCQPCTATVWTPDESGGEGGLGPRPFADTKEFWVD